MQLYYNGYILTHYQALFSYFLLRNSLNNKAQKIDFFIFFKKVSFMLFERIVFTNGVCYTNNIVEIIGYYSEPLTEDDCKDWRVSFIKNKFDSFDDALVAVKQHIEK